MASKSGDSYCLVKTYRDPCCVHQHDTKCEITPRDYLWFRDRFVSRLQSLSFHLPVPLVTDVIDSSDDIGNVDPPTMVALHGLDVADIIDGENSGNCRCLEWPEKDKGLTSSMAGRKGGLQEKPNREPPVTPVHPRAGTSSSDGEE